MRVFFSFFLFAILTSLLSCSNDSSKTVNIEELLKEGSYDGKNVGSPLGIFVSTFLKNHPDIGNNNITFEKGKKDFAKEFDEKLKSGFLNDMVFSCLGVDRDIITKKIIASFSVGATGKDSVYAITVFLDASVDEESAAKLKQYSDYKIQASITMPKDELDEKYDLGPSYLYFRKKILHNTLLLRHCLEINVHSLKADLKSFSEIPRAN